MNPENLFRWLLRLFPADFRGDFGDQMAATFSDQRRDVLANGSRMRGFRLWFDTVAGILATAPREHLDMLRSDVSFALRSLRRQPGFTLVAVMVLAIGIGANTAVFTIVNGVLLESFPYKDPSRLVVLFEQLPGAPIKFGFSPPDFGIVRDLARSYSGFAAYRTLGYELSGLATPQRINGARISPALMSVLGVAPAIGRALTDEDDRQNARVAVVSHTLWTQVFGRDPSLLGRTVALDGRPYTVVGIMPEGFVFPPRGADLNGEPADVFVPMSFLPSERRAFGMLYNNTVLARLKPDVTIGQARAEISSLIRPLAERYPPFLSSLGASLSVPIVPLDEETVHGSRRMILVVMAAVALVLLIACADVASLILTRSASRQRELAIRAAVGASRARIVRQLLTEGFVLAAAGSAVGLLVAYWSMRGLLVLAGERLPRTESITFDRRIFVFTLALAAITPLVFAILPALKGARTVTSDALKDKSSPLGSRKRPALLGLLVVGQFAIALVLSVNAGLLVRSFIRLVQTDPGFRVEQAVRATVTLPVGRYRTPQEVKAFYPRLIDAARTIPGLVSIGAATELPLGVRDRRAFSADPSAQSIPAQSRLIAPTWATGGYFEALGIPIVRGRYFTDADGPDTQRVAIINDRLARLLWPDADPIGHRVRWGIDIRENQNPWMTIVGVIGNVKQAGLDTPAMPQIYAPVAQDDSAGPLFRTVNLVVRSRRETASSIADVRSALRGLDAELPATLQTLDDMVGASLQPQRFSLLVMMVFAALALTLAAFGAYGVLANTVAQQTHDIGVRVALGATRPDVMWMVFRRALTLAAIGVAIGTVGAFVTTRALSSLLFEVRPTDAVSFLAAAASLSAIAFVASLAPAWRATRVDPLVALRTE